VKILPIASLSLALVLTGCASAPLGGNQTKLVEYEKCLEWNEKMLDREIQILATKPETYNKTLDRIALVERLQATTFEQLLVACQKYRP
jgi:hypothetical protein